MKDKSPSALPTNGRQNGMTLRQYYAGQALMAAWQGFDKGYYEGGTEDIAACAFHIADAMIAAGEQS